MDEGRKSPSKEAKAQRGGNEHEFSLLWLPVSAQWRNLRRICKSHLFANQILDANQNLRRKKVQELLTDIHNSSLNGDAVDIGKAAFKTSLNLLSNTIFSVDLAGPNSATGRDQPGSSALKKENTPQNRD
nr:geraniol 8-hydroxylase [Quercus suber]